MANDPDVVIVIESSNIFLVMSSEQKWAIRCSRTKTSYKAIAEANLRVELFTRPSGLKMRMTVVLAAFRVNQGGESA